MKTIPILRETYLNYMCMCFIYICECICINVCK